MLGLGLATLMTPLTSLGLTLLVPLIIALRIALEIALGVWLSLRILSSLLGLILGLLSRRRRHDAVIMLRMLKIIFGHDAVTAGIGVAGQLQILFIDMAGQATDLHFGTGRIIGAIGVEAAAVIAAATAAAAIATMLRPAAASTRALHYDPSLADEMSATGAHSKLSRLMVRFRAPARPRIYSRYRPSLRSRLLRPATGIIPDPYSPNLAQDPCFSKEILMVSSRLGSVEYPKDRVQPAQFQALETRP
jgi:hypothetical protein